MMYYAGGFIGSLFAGLFVLLFLFDLGNLPLTVPAAYADATPAMTAGPVVSVAFEPLANLDELAKRDPMALGRLGRQRYTAQVRGYRCTFLKRERVNGKLTEEQEIEVRFRESPLSVYMIWTKNADETRRALFIDVPENVDSKGRKLARVEPNGAILRLFVRDITVPIHGKRAQKASRRFIDDFGLRSTWDLLEGFNRVAEQKGVLDLRYAGESRIDGRPTYVIERYLPYTQEGGPYPDAKMVLHLDQEWLLPVAVYSYADHAGRELLASYIYTDVELNPDFTAEDFRF